MADLEREGISIYPMQDLEMDDEDAQINVSLRVSQLGLIDTQRMDVSSRAETAFCGQTTVLRVHRIITKH